MIKLAVGNNSTGDRPVIESIKLPTAAATKQTSADKPAVQQAQANLTQTLEQFIKAVDQTAGDHSQKLQVTVSTVMSLLETLKKLG
ncbi:hypothetical protein [Nostoc sp. FACHB-110]|uniref:hypothetical protein n=1 Tax=Nostoc sp. FACHB-110 TaxID=2692834 RepID=UPI0016820F61|nr:hypothetical protein [Nostoc sp. FACHB-110]MBD2435415.1 hypothetical protein [Nostoc sp. FACHB-110]